MTPVSSGVSAIAGWMRVKPLLAVSFALLCGLTPQQVRAEIPPKVPPVGIVPASAVSAGIWHTCALLSTGNVQCWGDNTYGQSAPPLGISAVAVSAGGYHTCALVLPGNVLCWGKTNVNHPDYLIDDLSHGYINPLGESAPYLGGDAVAVSAGYEYTCALLSSGNVTCWGRWFLPTMVYTGGDAVAVSGFCALLSNGNTTCGYSGGDAVAVSAGYSHYCALLSSGNVECSGSNFHPFFDYYTGQAESYLGGDAVAVSAGYTGTCVLLSTSEVVCWGGVWGALPEGILYGGRRIFYGEGPVVNAVAVSAGYEHGCALVNELLHGSILCWGDNSRRQSEPHESVLAWLALPNQTMYAPPVSADGAIEVKWGWGYDLLEDCWTDPFWYEVYVARNPSFVGETHIYGGFGHSVRYQAPEDGDYYFRVTATDSCGDTTSFEGPNHTIVKRIAGP